MKRIKTSTKIWLGLASVAVALCVVNAVVARGQYKKYEALARSLVEQLDKTPIRALDITYSPEFGGDHVSYPLGRDDFPPSGNRQIMHISVSLFENIRIEGDTMYIENYDNYRRHWGLLSSSSLETVVIHQDGKPDEVIDMRPAPEPGAAPAPETHTEPESH